jgi:hypothetical protein
MGVVFTAVAVVAISVGAVLALFWGVKWMFDDEGETRRQRTTRREAVELKHLRRFRASVVKLAITNADVWLEAAPIILDEVSKTDEAIDKEMS